MRTSNSMLTKVKEYINYKRKLGFKFESEEQTLRNFARYADANFPREPVTIMLVLLWVKTKPHLKPITKLSHFSAVRGLAQYLRLDDPKTELIPKNIYTAWFRRMTPYVYSDQEIAKIMSTDPGPRTNQFDTLTQRTMVGLLLCTGMRIGEALALRKRDVDLEKGVITIRQFKKMPMRLLPINDTVLEKLKGYDSKREKLVSGRKDKNFFLTSNGNAIPYVSFHGMWKRILGKTGIGDVRPVPRLHDLRHTFACNHLLRAYKENRNIDDAIYMLSIYLGHTVIAGTYWYLSATPELLEQCVKRVEKSLTKRKNEVKQ